MPRQGLMLIAIHLVAIRARKGQIAMVDTRIRKNERCVIGLPACDWVLFLDRSCFIAYGFPRVP